MNIDDLCAGRNDYLKRLPAEHYRGLAFVHWSMTMESRKTGWLDPGFHTQFREILIHTMFRYALCCPIYCCMPDHIHVLWAGVLEGSDQRNASKYFRKQVNVLLDQRGARFQDQPYDHVLDDDERANEGLGSVVDYIARNPEREKLVQPNRHRDYPYSGCVIPGYPELTLWQKDYWERFWRIYAHMRENGVSLLVEKKD